jgi:acyl transferase domain-containing protein
MSANVAVLFPGQGAYSPTLLSEARTRHGEIDEAFAEIDAVSSKEFGRSVSQTIFAATPPSLEVMVKTSNDLLQLAIYGASVATYKILVAAGVRPGVLMGHSFGEIGALVSAGAFSVGQGAQMVCDRSLALRESCDLDGFMVALATDAATAEHLVALVGPKETAVAVENHATQTVVSGSTSAMERLVALAALLNISAVRLDSAYPFHSPLMSRAVGGLAARLRRYRPRPLTIPVFSAILGRVYSPEDDLAEALASHLVGRVRFAEGLRVVCRQQGMRVFVECGALATLTKMTRRVLAHDDVRAVSLLDPEAGPGSIEAALSTLTETAPRLALADGPARGAPTAPALEAQFERFWAARGAALFRELKESALAYVVAGQVETGQRAASAVAAAAPAAPAPPPSIPAANELTREQVLADLAASYATALEYPPEVFTETVALEAELGIDSVRQTELFARVAEKYGLPARPSGFRLSDYQQFGAVVDFVFANAGRRPAGASARAPGAAPATASAGPPLPPRGHSRKTVLDELRSMYASALEYPEEVFTDGALLEAELGIDSVKQTELFARAAQRYSLSVQPGSLRLVDYQTLARIADLICEHVGEPGAAAAPIVVAAARESGDTNHAAPRGRIASSS